MQTSSKDGFGELILLIERRKIGCKIGKDFLLPFVDGMPIGFG
jgi:hypothetical protein